MLPFILSGCLFACANSDYSEPVGLVRIPSQWSSPRGQDTSDPSTGWLEDFDDEHLKVLVREALGSNYSFRTAAARLAAAEALGSARNANRLPRVSLGLDGSRSKIPAGEGSNRTASISNTYNGLFSFEWEIDLWGKLRDASEIIALDTYSERARYQGARLSLAANVALAWFTLIEARQQLELAEETLEIFENHLRIVNSGYDRGIYEALDVRLTSADVFSVRNSLQQKQQAKDLATRSLEVLLGRYPASEIEATDSLPKLVEAVPVGLPSELISRRPDLVEGKLAWLAEQKRLSLAEKALLPSFELTGQAGLAAPKFSELINSQSVFWNMFGSLLQPLFRGGQLRAEISAADARTQEALLDYGEKVLDAFLEVELALASEGFIRSQVDSLQKAAIEASLAQRLAVANYERGLVNVLTVLDSQRRAFDTQSALLETRRNLLQTRIRLYLALGGEFDNCSQDEDI